MSPEQSKDRKRPDQPEKPKSIPDTAKEPDAKSADLLERNFPVVGIGASAGGLEAFTQFLSKVPEKSGMAFVLIQHLDPSHPSSLVELLARKCPIPSKEAEKGERIQPDQA